MDFARHYGTVILPTKPYTPRHKGKIESGIKYVKDNALKGRRFSCLEEQKRFLIEWEMNVADTRIHGTTRKQVRRMFETERGALQALPLEAFPFYHEGRRKVHRDGHIEVAKGYYSVPPEYLAREVWVRWDSRMLRVFNQNHEQVAVHVRVAPGRFNTLRAHIADEKISGVERGAEYLLSKAVCIGEDAAQWAGAMLEARGIEGVRVLLGFIALSKKHPAHAINQASKTALEANLFRLKPLRVLVKQYSEQTDYLLTQEHEIIRPMADYQQFVTVTLKPQLIRIDDEPTTAKRSETPQAFRTSFHLGGAPTGSGGQSTRPRRVSGVDRRR